MRDSIANAFGALCMIAIVVLVFFTIIRVVNSAATPTESYDPYYITQSPYTGVCYQMYMASRYSSVPLSEIACPTPTPYPTPKAKK